MGKKKYNKNLFTNAATQFQTVIKAAIGFKQNRQLIQLLVAKFSTSEPHILFFIFNSGKPMLKNKHSSCHLFF